MTKYKTIQEPKQIPSKIFCNICGREIKLNDTLPSQDYIHVDKTWGYCSSKDNQVHSFDICESCYDKLVKAFKIKPTIK